jgi:DNA polymerase II small subunit
MDQEKILDMFVKHGILAQEEAVYYIQNKENPRKYIQRLFNEKPQFPLVLTLNDLMEIEDRIIDKEVEEEKPDQDITKVEEPLIAEMEPVKEDVPEVTDKKKDEFDIKISLGKKYKPLAAEYEGEIQILEDITGNSTCVGELTDFKNYFNDRFTTIKKIIRNTKSEIGGAVSLARAKMLGGEVKVIGMVQEVSITKKGHKLFRLEDPDDNILCLINANNTQLINLDIIHDEVIGAVGKYDKKRGMMYIEKVIWPEVPRYREANKATVPLSAAFISDIHIGSKTFLTRSWNKFIDWMNGKTDNKSELNVVSSLKYLVIVGDLVDGIGNYPNQEGDLAIKDIFEQYEALSYELDRIPEHIEVIVLPGNHDAVRPAEPQPALPDMITEKFSRELHLCGNPCYMRLSGVDVLAYHGRSIDDFVTTFEHVSYETPLEAMKEMLNRRHLLPIYGKKTPIAPEHRDYMAIRRVPDIFVTGHVHSFGAKNYRDVIMINSSAWQSQTDYQKMLNFVPDPAKVPVINLQTRKPYQMNFLSE